MAMLFYIVFEGQMSKTKWVLVGYWYLNAGFQEFYSNVIDYYDITRKSS